MPVRQPSNGFSGTMKLVGVLAAIVALLAAVMVPANFVFREMHEDIQGLVAAIMSVEDHARDKRGSIGGDIASVERELEEERIDAAYHRGVMDERTAWLMRMEERQ